MVEDCSVTMIVTTILDNIVGLSNIYQDVITCLNNISKTHVSADDKNIKTKLVIKQDVDLVISNITEHRCNRLTHVHTRGEQLVVEKD